ncbi:hypothetical protein EYF80_051757 [Liparis tanakae]|uniref:Uncharacterized protein n=1 Tax=Liparis tanakae TaxID=230148 RepID=A0A4Z2FAZ6_9TELE|nr:hypothetical protein EYF80_051757 [Liparis tanakae]
MLSARHNEDKRRPRTRTPKQNKRHDENAAARRPAAAIFLRGDGRRRAFRGAVVKRLGEVDVSGGDGGLVRHLGNRTHELEVNLEGQMTSDPFLTWKETLASFSLAVPSVSSAWFSSATAASSSSSSSSSAAASSSAISTFSSSSSSPASSSTPDTSTSNCAGWAATASEDRSSTHHIQPPRSSFICRGGGGEEGAAGAAEHRCRQLSGTRPFPS